jgi:hypothetical protein
MLRLRMPSSLVAVFVLVALVVGVLIGGRLMQDWNSFHKPAPAGGVTQSALAQLEAVPLRLPVFASAADCKDGPHNSEGSYGSGPIYGDGGQTSSSSWGTYFHNRAYANVKVAGPVLVRVRDLLTNQPVVFVGPNAGGPVVGTDTVDGVLVEQHAELVIDTTKTSTDLGAWSGTRRHSFDWVFTAGVPKSWSGSTGWQIDGIGFSEVFVSC